MIPYDVNNEHLNKKYTLPVIQRKCIKFIRVMYVQIIVHRKSNNIF